MLERKLKILIGEDAAIIPRVTVLPFRGAAEELYQLAFGRRPHAPSEELVRNTLTKTAAELNVIEFTARFLFSEWTYVVDAWQLDSAEAYGNVPRLGRKNRMGAKQRARLWPVFAATREMIKERGFHTWAQIFGEVAAYIPIANISHSVILSLTRRRIWECPSCVSSRPSHRRSRMRCFLPAISGSGFFSNLFRGPRSAWMCAADRRSSRSTIEPRIRFARLLIALAKSRSRR